MSIHVCQWLTRIQSPVPILRVRGRRPKQPTLHKGMISRYSKYFRAAFNGSFKEASSGVVSLPEEYPETFDIVHTWLKANELTQSEDGEDIDCTSLQLVNVFIFADKYDMPELRNEAIDGLILWVLKKKV